MNKEEVLNQIREVGVIPFLRVDSADSALFVAEYVIAGGIPIIEVATTIPNSEHLIQELTRRFPRVCVGCEIVAGVDEARRHMDAGAVFLTSPGLDLEVVEYCAENAVAVLPGAMTPTEIMLAYRAGADFVKVFPCAHIASESYIRSLRAPLPHIPLVAAGGITQSAAPRYIMAGAVAIGVGEELIPHQAIRFHEGEWIRELASRFLNFVKQARSGEEA